MHARTPDSDLIQPLTLPPFLSPSLSLSIVQVRVRNGLRLHKTYWRDREEEAKRGALGYAVVDASQSMWCMDEDECERTGEQVMQVMVNLVKPPPSEDDVRWRRGRRKERPKPNAFFADDTDAYGLAPLLMAMQFCETGECFVPSSGRREKDVACLPEDVRTQLEVLLADDNP